MPKSHQVVVFVRLEQPDNIEKMKIPMEIAKNIILMAKSIGNVGKKRKTAQPPQDSAGWGPGLRTPGIRSLAKATSDMETLR